MMMSKIAPMMMSKAAIRLSSAYGCHRRRTAAENVNGTAVGWLSAAVAVVVVRSSTSGSFFCR